MHFPLVDFSFVSAEQNVGHLPALVVGGSGVDRRLEQIVLKGIVERTLFIADGTRNESHNGIGNHRSREFAPGEHIVADGNFLRDQMFADAIIHPLVVPAQDNQILCQRQGVCQGLREDFAVGRGKNHFIVVAFTFQLLNAAVHRFDLHHHPGLTAKGIVVHLAMLA